MPFTLPELSYAYDALEPYIDAQTMQIHHTKHHQAYIDKLNDALANFPEYTDKPLPELLASIKTLPEPLQVPVRNHGGGHANHSLFWTILTPQSTMHPELQKLLTAQFGSLDNFKLQFTQAATGRFGSGWAWLIWANDQLTITATPNQDSPLMDGEHPLLGLDVWEHAYYLKYQNRRPDYVQAFWNVVNWEQVWNNYQQAQS